MDESKFAKWARIETLRKFADKMGVNPKKLEQAESVRYYPYFKDDEILLEVTFFVPTGEDFPRYEELGFNESLQWFIYEIWKPQVRKRIASLSRRYRDQKFQLTFYTRLAEKLGMDIEEFWSNQLREAFIREFSRRDEEAPVLAPKSFGDDFYAAVGFGFAEEAGIYLQDSIDRIAEATIDLLANRLEEKHETSAK